MNKQRPRITLDPDQRSYISYNSFPKALLNIIGPSDNKVFHEINIHDHVGMKLLIRIRLGFSHLGQHKFRHNSEDTVNALCSCNIHTQKTLHVFQFFNDIREILMIDLTNINRSLLSLNQDKLISFLLYGTDVFHNKTNFKILICIVQPIKSHTDLRIPFSKSLYSFRFS